MSFREKMAWVMLVALAAASVAYFVPMWSVTREAGFIAPASTALGVISVFILVAIAVVGAIIAALSDVKSANAEADERERGIISIAENVGATVLGAGVVLIIVLAHLLDGIAWVVPGLVAALVASQIVTYVVQLCLYRVR